MPIGQEVTEVRPNHRFDESRLEHYMRERMPELRGTFRVAQFLAGQSNPTFMVSLGDARFVMRKKPSGVLLQSAHQVEREYRIITALVNTEVPVPRTRMLCEDSGVIGTPFFIMDYVEGRIFADPLLPECSREERAAIYDSMNDTMARLHRVDYKAVGLDDYGRPEAYVARQISRWTKQYHAAITDRPIPEMEYLIDWLPKHMPSEDETAIAHGDFRIGNLIVHPREPRIIAVLDWELSTLGHPLADLAWNCLSYHYPAGLEDTTSFQNIDLDVVGIPTEEDYLASYCRRVGRPSVSDFIFFVVFALFRGASIAQGIAYRAKMGNASAPDAELRGKRAAVSARVACDLARRV
ncbi:MAG TPA: phosphotransferase [Candidatus Binataceae bacterium]|nr:phosphotransferase [Candidatus Binataceae bacterium]